MGNKTRHSNCQYKITQRFMVMRDPRFPGVWLEKNFSVTSSRTAFHLNFSLKLRNRQKKNGSSTIKTNSTKVNTTHFPMKIKSRKMKETQQFPTISENVSMTQVDEHSCVHTHTQSTEWYGAEYRVVRYVETGPGGVLSSSLQSTVHNHTNV